MNGITGFTLGAILSFILIFLFLIPDGEEEKMPEFAEDNSTSKYLVVNEENFDNDVFNTMDEARKWIEHNVDFDDFDEVRVYRITQEYKINSNKKILFSKV